MTDTPVKCPNCGSETRLGHYEDYNTAYKDSFNNLHIINSCMCYRCHKQGCAYLYLIDGSIWYFKVGSDVRDWIILRRKVPSKKHIGGFKVIQ